MKLHQPIHRGRCIGDGGDCGLGGACHHDYRQSKRPSGNQFARGSGATGILGHDDVYAVLCKQLPFGCFLERAACCDQLGLRWQRRGVGRIDAADEVAVPGCGGESGKILLADGEEHPARRPAQRFGGGRHVRDNRPTVARAWLPRRTADDDEGNAGGLGGGFGMARDLFGKGMRGVNQCVDALGAQVSDQPINASESADAPGDGRRNGRARAPGKRERRLKPWIVGEGAGESRGFAGAAQDQYSHA